MPLDFPYSGPWICDKCGELITSVEDGWVQWLSIQGEDGYHSEGLQLVHSSRAAKHENRNRCIYDAQVVWREKDATTADSQLRDFIGPNGLMQLLSFIDNRRFKNRSEVVEMIKRIYIPGYDQVRHHLEPAVDQGVFEPNTPQGFPWQSDIKAVQDWLKEREE